MLAVAVLLLAGCATERYYPVYLEGGGYYVTERAYEGVSAGARYDSLFALGVYPWWVHTFYTPYYYPNYFSYYHPYYDRYYSPFMFAGWYPSWPYYSSHDGLYSRGWPPQSAYRHGPAWPGSGRPHPPAPGTPVAPLQPRVVVAPHRPAIGERAADRETMYRGFSRQQPGSMAPVRPQAAPPPDAWRSPPSAPSAVAPPSGRPFGSEPARIHRAPSERSPSQHDD